MVPLSQLPVPLPNQPPVGYHLEHGDISVFSTTTACHTVINKRDRFLGETRCVICGDHGLVVQPCHIIKPEEGTWSYLQDRGWISSETEVLPQHEPRNGLILCGNHHSYFDGYDFFLSASSPKFRSLSSSTIPIIPLFGSSMAKLLPLTSRIAMHHSLAYLSSMRCVPVDSTPSHPPIQTCPKIVLGKTGYYRRVYSMTSRILSNGACAGHRNGPKRVVF
ncbi:hypothetical protein JOM56_015712 [Amanita muscaria]